MRFWPIALDLLAADRVIEQGLQLVLRRPLKRSERPRVTLPECHAGGGVLPGVDLDENAGLLDRMESRC